MYDIALYGHLTVDRVFTQKSQYTTLGAIANVWRALLDIDSNISVGLSPMYFGEALIYSNEQTAQRTSKALLNLSKKTPEILNSKIHHFMYINEFEDLNILTKCRGVITADICTGKALDLTALKNIDYLFIADEEKYNIEQLRNNIKGAVILHYPDGSSVYTKSQTFSYALPKEYILRNINVLGAGDIFASCFLYKLITEKDLNLKAFAEFSNLKTSELLKQKHEKI